MLNSHYFLTKFASSHKYATDRLSKQALRAEMSNCEKWVKRNRLFVIIFSHRLIRINQTLWGEKRQGGNNVNCVIPFLIDSRASACIRRTKFYLSAEGNVLERQWSTWYEPANLSRHVRLKPVINDWRFIKMRFFFSGPNKKRLSFGVPWSRDLGGIRSGMFTFTG